MTCLREFRGAGGASRSAAIDLACRLRGGEEIRHRDAGKTDLPRRQGLVAERAAGARSRPNRSRFQKGLKRIEVTISIGLSTLERKGEAIADVLQTRRHPRSTAPNTTAATAWCRTRRGFVAPRTLCEAPLLLTLAPLCGERSDGIEDDIRVRGTLRE